MPSPRFGSGQPGNPLGRPKGTLNKLTKNVRQAFEETFTRLQEPGSPFNLYDWATTVDDKGNLPNLSLFYQMVSRLIPLQLQAQVNHTHELLNQTTEDWLRQVTQRELTQREPITLTQEPEKVDAAELTS